MSLLNKLPCELLEIIFKMLPRSAKTNLYLLFSQDGFGKDMKAVLYKLVQEASDSVVKWECIETEYTHNEEEERVLNTDVAGRTAFLINSNIGSETLGVLIENPLLPNMSTRDKFLVSGRDETQFVVSRLDICVYGYELKKGLSMATEDDVNSPLSDHDVLVIYLNPAEEIFWKLCDAKSVPGEALVVDKSAQEELLFFGYKTGREEVGSRLGYVRAGLGLMHYHHEYPGQYGDEIRWEISDGFYVLCAREKLF